MRKIIATTFITLDGVMQAPGGPVEDTTGDFRFGGWSFHYWDEMMGSTMNEIMNSPFDLLLGKRTYEIFAAYWPNNKSDSVVALKFNSTRKYVVSHSPSELFWKNTTFLTTDVVKEVRKLKSENNQPDLWVHGSGNLIQTLLGHDLIDQFLVWTFPVTIGKGKRLFEESNKPAAYKLIDSKISTTGVIIATYSPAGTLKVGSF